MGARAGGSRVSILRRAMLLGLGAALALLGDASAATLRRGHQAEPESLDPQKVDGAEEQSILLDLFEGLTRTDAAGATVPGVAQSWDVAPDGLTWVFHLRSDARWSDGVAVTAEDFVYGFRRALDPATAAPYVAVLFPIVGAREFNQGRLKDPSALGVRAIDARTLALTLTQPTAYLPDVLSLAVAYPLPRRAVEADQGQWTRPGHMISNGAYRLAAWEPQQEIRLVRADTYWDAASVKIDEVRWQVVASDETAFKRFRAGELDFCRLPANEIPWARKNMAASFHADAALWTAYVIVNVGRPPLDDPRVREALALTIDREALADRIDPRGEGPAYGLIPPGMPLYHPQPPGWATLSKAERVARARALYAAAGYGPDHPLTLHLIYALTEDRKRVTSALALMWKEALGAAVTMDNEEYQVFSAQTRHHDFQLSLSGWIADYPDPWTFLSTLASDAGDLNTSGYRNPAYDALLATATQTLDPAARMATLEAAERLVSRDLPVIPLYYDVRPYLVSPELAGYRDNPLDIHPSQDLSFPP